MGRRKKPFSRIGFARISCSRITTGRLFILTVALLASVFLHSILTLQRISTARQYSNCKWIKDQEIQKLIDDGRKLQLIRASEGIWTVEPIGRLGNLMGQYATLYGLAKLNGKQAYVLPKMHKQLSKLFRLTLPVLHEDVASRINWTMYALHDWMSEEYRHITFDHVKLIGYTSSWTFYHYVHDEILREFSFHDFIKQEANNYLSMIQGSKEDVTFVGVHIRRGDYARVMPKIWKGVLADEAYIKKAMDYFERKYTNPVFVVTSNDMDWCRQHIHTARGEVYFSGDGLEYSPGRDFALLAHCNHTIMTIGTFGFWVGYLAGGDTVYLANFTLPESEFLQVFRYEAAYLPHWTGIPADLSPLLRNGTKP